jgi:hypothetical protein
MIPSGVVRVDERETATAESEVADVPAPQVAAPLPARSTDVELPTAVVSAAATVTVHVTEVEETVPAAPPFETVM